MKQKPLTDEQKELLKRLEATLKECEEKNIAFVFDREDCSVTAYNSDGVECTYAGRVPEDYERDEKMDWTKSDIVEICIDYFDSFDQDFILKF